MPGGIAGTRLADAAWRGSGQGGNPAPLVRSDTVPDGPSIRVKRGRPIGRDSLDSYPVIAVKVGVGVGRLPLSASEPVGCADATPADANTRALRG